MLAALTISVLANDTFRRGQSDARGGFDPSVARSIGSQRGGATNEPPAIQEWINLSKTLSPRVTKTVGRGRLGPIMRF
jgi:hypothetical protein